MLLGAVAAYLQFTQQQNAAHDLLISNQVAKGFEQLGSDKLTIRLGGIYALEGVMNTSLQYHQPVLEALCAFVREGTIGMVINGAPASDIQATMTVVGRRSNGPGRINLARARLSKADLPDANLTGANLTGANLTGAELPQANLKEADLAGTDLTGAYLAEADLYAADLAGADLTGAFLAGARLTYANLSGTNLTGATLSATFGLKQEQLDQACGTPRTLPGSLTLDKPMSAAYPHATA